MAVTKHSKGFKISCGKVNGKPKVWWFGKDEKAAEEAADEIRTLWHGVSLSGGNEWTDEAYEQAETIRLQAKNPRLKLSLPKKDLHKPKPITTYDAIETFKKEVMESGGRKKSTKLSFCFQLDLLKASIPDIPIHQIGRDEVYECAQHWLRRPNRKGSDQPISIHTIEGELQSARRFLEWLKEKYNFRLSDNVDIKKILSKKGKRLETKQDTLKKISGHDLFTDEELLKLWMQATPRRSIYMLLAMNFGFGSSEIAQLTFDEVDLEKGIVKRIRDKSGVYCEWRYMFPETVQAIKDYLPERNQWEEVRKTTARSKDLDFWLIRPGNPLILCDNGERLSHVSDKNGNCDSIANTWWALCKRAEVRPRGFKYMRKTFAHKIKTLKDGENYVGSGEVAKLYLSHGHTTSDDLMEVYTNQDYDRLGHALRVLRKQLGWLFGDDDE